MSDGATTASLLEVLALEKGGTDHFVGLAPSIGGPRIFGGGVVAQAMLAAYDTVEAQICHSLHCYFIHPGDPATPVHYHVTRSRDGASFTTRHVAAMQDGRPILEMIASFQRTSEGMEHCIAMPASPSPDSLADDDMRGASVGIELRNRKVPRPGMVATIEPPNHQMWFRSRVPLGDAIRLHQAALAYASDFPQLPTIVQPHPVTWRTPGFQFASLDHAIWFHRPLDFTHWHLCDLDTPSSSQQRGLCRSSVFTQDGTLVATVMQEAMIRMRRSPL